MTYINILYCALQGIKKSRGKKEKKKIHNQSKNEFALYNPYGCSCRFRYPSECPTVLFAINFLKNIGTVFSSLELSQVTFLVSFWIICLQSIKQIGKKTICDLKPLTKITRVIIKKCNYQRKSSVLFELQSQL